MYRKEHDSVGNIDIPKEAYYGVNAQRAVDNFQITKLKLDPLFVESLVEIKKATAMANMELGELDIKIGEAIIKAADEMLQGNLYDQMIVDPIQGGAGTSTNMNINEVLANRAIELLGGEKGDYTVVSPNDHVNKGQSTNDVYPSAGKLTFLKMMDQLLPTLSDLAAAFKVKAEAFKDIKKMGRTQLSDAVPITVGAEFNAYYVLTKRNIARLVNVRSEISSLNMGGTAIGTGISAHNDLPNMVVKHLNSITGFDLEVAEDLVDGTQNIDCYAVVSDCLKTIALSTSKVANDIRLLSSGPRTGLGELFIPSRQNGSSIMPGKINPVIPEVVTQAAFLVAGHNVTISMAVEAGQLELNAFEPVIFYTMIESFNALTNAFRSFIDNCVIGIEVNEKRCRELLERSTYLTTSLASHIGYDEASSITKQSLREDKTVLEVAREHGVSESILKQIMD
ncbi:aspartate ammonia-lyase [Vagococcus intermedius]|uniref:Aspartate ammonia-lyase n=1 Tax=Vagococcus intermedius TaxID=2991418 RepID=A0AAF0I776_9ENTE|nr:aspartate ammonia-lyase [Vagococcus intermedius]WEG73155.1 aspartate ammonia-lyase [Vagococcus intermedius]WEG75239.1 aspartate ammonia-lyase [Vagococcus intermedius]